MGNNPHEHVCELFDFECMCKNDRTVYIWKQGFIYKPKRF
jgi:hypothetical protein